MTSSADKKNIVIMAGGTGGHVFPALAVAEELSKQGYNIIWFGTQKGIEATLVPEHGYEIQYINVQGIRGKKLLHKILAPIKILIAIASCLKKIITIKPVLVIGMGGYAAGPGGIAAWLLQKPLVIHEQNSIAGTTNKILSKFATKVLTGFPNSLAERKNGYLTGNPVRQSITSIYEPKQRLLPRAGKLQLLVLGGSLGARKLNQVLPAVMAQLGPEQQPLIWHQSGRANYEDTATLYRNHGVKCWRLEPFIDDMAQALSWADLVICRAGALTISELSAGGVASILVPFPFAADDHQTKNAKYLSDNDAAILISENEFTADKLVEILTSPCCWRQQLYTMAENCRRLAKPNASLEVAKLCLEACNK